MKGMKYIKTLIFILIFMVSATPIWAQNTPAATPSTANATAQKPFNLMDLGKNLVDDTVDFYDRYVHINESLVSENLPLTEPIVSNREISDWLGDKAAVLFSFKPDNFRRSVQANQPFFTPEGYTHYQRTLQRANLQDIIARQKYQLMTIKDGLGGVDQQGLMLIGDKKRYRWIASFPIIMRYEGVANRSYDMMIEAEIVRIPYDPQEENALPYAIHQIILKPRS